MIHSLKKDLYSNNLIINNLKETPILSIREFSKKGNFTVNQIKGTLNRSQYSSKIESISFYLDKKLKNCNYLIIYPYFELQTDILMINENEVKITELKNYLAHNDSKKTINEIICYKDTLILGEVMLNFDFHKAIDQLKIRLKYFEIMKIGKKINCFLIFKCEKKDLTDFKKKSF